MSSTDQPEKVQPPAKLKKSYDIIFVGDALASRAMAMKASQQGLQCCILSQSPSAPEPFIKAPMSKQWILNAPTVNSLWESATPQEPQTLAPTVIDAFGTPLTIQSYKAPPLTCIKGDLKSFKGFENPSQIAEHEELSRFFAGSSFAAGDWAAVVECLFQSTEHLVFRQKPVTACSWEGQTLAALELNGRETVKGSHFFFSSQFPWILKEMAGHEKGLASFLKKLKWFSSLELTFFHPAQEPSPQDSQQSRDPNFREDDPTEKNPSEPDSFESNSPETHHSSENAPDSVWSDQWPAEPFLLFGSKNRPCLGSFVSPRAGEPAQSRWQALIPSELDQDSENIGQFVKEIKKQVKRAFPELWGPPLKEHICYRPCHRAQLAGVEKYTNKFKNLDLITPLTSDTVGPIFELQKALAFDWEVFLAKEDAPQHQI